MGSLMAKPGLRELQGNKSNGFLVIPWVFLLLLTPLLLPAAAQAAATNMKHSPPDYFVPDRRIQMEAQVTDPAGVKLVRCYFKAAGEANLVFVPMHTIGKNRFTGILPAPSAATTQIEYLFLSVNTANKVVRSQMFSITQNAVKGTPDWQKVPKQGDIRVSMELDKVPKKLPGFNDDITLDAVESTARFGVVALLYHSAADASSKSAVAAAQASTGASSAGGVTAGSAGWSTAAIVGVGVGAAVVVGGAAAAGGGGGGGGDKADPLTAATLLGDWNVTGDQNGGYSIKGVYTFMDDGYFLFDTSSTSPTGEQSTQAANGTWTLSGTRLTIFYLVGGGLEYTGPVDGNSKSFIFKSDDGDCNLRFKR